MGIVVAVTVCVFLLLLAIRPPFVLRERDTDGRHELAWKNLIYMALGAGAFVAIGVALSKVRSLPEADAVASARHASAIDTPRLVRRD